MADDRWIVIPPDLLPADGRFGSGPSRVPVDALRTLADADPPIMGTSHRRDPVKDMVGRIRGGLADLYGLPAGYEVVAGVGGATAFWDVAAFGLVRDRSAHFVCGEFSSKFAAVTSAAPHLADPVVVEATPGDAPAPRPVDGVDTAAYIHNETSTGVLAAWDRFGDELVLVDGTSAAGALPIDVATVDAYYFSPQKALGSEGGLWVALVSPLAIDRAEAVRSSTTSPRWIPPFLSFTVAVENARRNQTYNTPAIATLHLLDRRIEQLGASGGLAAAEARSRASSDHLYRWAEASSFAAPFVRDERLRSPTVVTIDLDPSVDATVLSGHLRANGIVDTESYRKLGRNQIRIATFPTIPTADVEALTACIDHVAGAM